MSEWCVLVGVTLVAISGVPGLFLSRRSMVGQWVADFLTLVGTSLGIAGVGSFLRWGEVQELALPSPISGGELALGIDSLSVVFLLPIYLISALGSIYGLGYWRQTDHPEDGCKLRLHYGLLAASMALLVVARNAILFLVAWEIMALSAFFLITTQDQEERTREIGWIYLVAAHLGTLC